MYEGPGDNNDCGISSSAQKANLYNATNALYTSATYVMTGLHPVLHTKKSPTSSVPRTFVGVRQKIPLTSGGPAYVYILVSTAMQQQTAYDTLINFGCDGSEIIMFDGGGSTQMKVGTTLIASSDSPDRPVPTFIVVKEN
ncbi:MAG: phosphodiester glycosidase family protein [Candidatus Peribacteria bacterium]|nr:phosphodiester glycosidase family protein [Candidatus Peribacteria bacterium]